MSEPSNRTFDFIEVCTPEHAPLAAMIIKRGGHAERWGLHNYNLSRASDFTKAKHDLIAKKPRHLWLSPPCTQFSSLQNFNWSKLGAEERAYKHKLLKQATVVWERCIQLANLQISLGGHAHVENPLRSTAWHLNSPNTQTIFISNLQNAT